MNQMGTRDGRDGIDGGDMRGVINFFTRWNEAVADIQRRKQEAADILLHKSTLPVVEIGQILFLNSKTGFSGESSVFINVAGEVICIGILKAQVVSKEKYSCVFIGSKNTKLQGIQENFSPGEFHEIDIRVKEWVIKKLIEIFPEDYKIAPQEEREEIGKVIIPEHNISYTIYSGIASQKKAHKIEAEIDGEKFVFENFGLQKLKGRFTVWISPRGETTPLIQNKLKNNTQAQDVDLRTASNAMMKNIRRILKSTDPKMKELQSELRKYKIES